MTTLQWGRTVTNTSFRGAPHPLAHWQAGEDLIAKKQRSFEWALCIATRADVSPFVGEGREVVVAAVTTVGAPGSNPPIGWPTPYLGRQT